jgi:hypothetical protein
MEEHRHRILSYAVLVSRGHVAGAAAGSALGLAAAAPAPDPGAATLRPGDGPVVGEV